MNSENTIKWFEVSDFVGTFRIMVEAGALFTIYRHLTDPFGYKYWAEVDLPEDSVKQILACCLLNGTEIYLKDGEKEV